MVRCKFKCKSKREYENWDKAKGNLYEYKFEPVVSGSEENKAFFAATPSGSLEVSCVTDGQFLVGAEYYLDLSIVEAVAPPA